MTAFIIITTVFSVILFLILIYVIVKKKKNSQINVEKQETITNNPRVPITKPQIKKPISRNGEEKVKPPIPNRNTKLVKKNESKQNKPRLPSGNPPAPINVKNLQKANLFLLENSPRTKKNIRLKKTVKRIIDINKKKKENK